MKWFWAILFTLAILAATLVVSQLVGFNLVWILIFGTTLWAAIDSSRLELKKYKSGISYGPVILFVAIALLWIVGLPWYLAVRYKITHGLMELKQSEPSRAGSESVATKSAPPPLESFGGTHRKLPPSGFDQWT